MIKGWVSRKGLERYGFIFEDENLPDGATAIIEGGHVEVQYDGNPKDSESYDDEGLARKLVFLMEHEWDGCFVVERSEGVEA
jgi:hypothetical protein